MKTKLEEKTALEYLSNRYQERLKVQIPSNEIIHQSIQVVTQHTNDILILFQQQEYFY